MKILNKGKNIKGNIYIGKKKIAECKGITITPNSIRSITVYFNKKYPVLIKKIDDVGKINISHREINIDGVDKTYEDIEIHFKDNTVISFEIKNVQIYDKNNLK